MRGVPGFVGGELGKVVEAGDVDAVVPKLLLEESAGGVAFMVTVKVATDDGGLAALEAMAEEVSWNLGWGVA